MLVLHPLALHKFRLLYTLAFRPGTTTSRPLKTIYVPIASFSLQDKLIIFSVFLHNLWNLVLDTRRNSVVRGGSGVSSGGGSVPLITVICRGMRPTPEERDEIVPLLAVFAALFGYLLVTIHDTEFYGLRSDQRRGTFGMTHPHLCYV